MVVFSELLLVPCKLLLCNIRVVQFLQAVPNETSEFAEFQELAQLTADFETSLGRASLIPEWKETEGDKLRRFSTDVELHFAVKKRKQVVAKARNLLVVSDYKTFLVIMLHKLVLGKNLFYLAVSD
jgi:hypothetical protein